MVNLRIRFRVFPITPIIIVGLFLWTSLFSQEDGAEESFSHTIQSALFSTLNVYENRYAQFGFSLIPELRYTLTLTPESILDGLISFKLFGGADSRQTEKKVVEGEFYRLWLRWLYYGQSQLELRLGLQKIDFGSAVLLRPLQWFNHLSYDDPLQQTPGVWGLLLRYYFIDNATLWLWTLYGNKQPRGMDLFTTYFWHPEAGGRIQFPMPRGEIGLSLHYRTASTEDTALEHLYSHRIPELRVGWDGKWDILIGLWIEMTLNHKFKDVGNYTDQLLINGGVDYTFPWGNGYNLVWENLIISYDTTPFAFADPSYESIMKHTYPIGLSDSIYFIGKYHWIRHDYYLSFGWEHQLESSVLNIIAYYQSQTYTYAGFEVFWNYTF